MRRKLRAFLALPVPERFGLVQAWLLLGALDLALRHRPFPAVQRGLERFSRRTAAPARIAPSRWAELIRIASHYHLRPVRCLPCSLALQLFLRRGGLEAELKIGVHKLPDGLHAHAWVESAGAAVGEPGEIETRFLPLTPALAPLPMTPKG
jgi:Transglutaminase-like superfamily